ncbi:MAG: translocation/assembly module TamB domain-containing protein [Deltaproteobacteria bacterium]|nr:translocation/assembly module TamB domain-containing protein [Deltaproteobacteria bacterium]
MTDNPPQSKWKKRKKLLLAVAGGLLALGAVAFGLAATFLQGPRLGGFLTAIVGKIGLPGNVQVGAMYWKPRVLWDLVTNTPTPFVLENVKIDDPDGTRVLDVSRLATKVALRSAMAGKVRLFDVDIGPHSYWRFGSTKDGSKVGFLAALIPPPPPLPPGAKRKPPSDDSGFVLELVNAKLNGLSAEFDFPGAWGLLLKDTEGDATFIIDGPFVGFDANNLHARQGSFLRILDGELLPFDDVKVKRVATTREWKNDIFLEVEAGRTGRSVLTGKGFFTHIYDEGPPGIDLHAEFAHAGDALAAVAAGHKIEGLTVAGPEATVVLDLKQPFSAIDVKAKIAKLDVGYAGGHAKDLQLALDFSGAEPMTVGVRDLKFKVPQGGNVELGARMVVGGEATADLRLRNVVPDAFLPPALKLQASGIANGQVQAKYNFANQSGDVSLKGVRFARKYEAGLPRNIFVDGVITGSSQRADVKQLQVTIPGADVQLRGRVDIVKKLVALQLKAQAQNLPLALSFLHPPDLLPKSASLQVHVDGSLDNPNVVGSAAVRSVGIGELGTAPELHARFMLKDGTAHVQSLKGEIFGGKIDVSGQAQIYKQSIERMLAAPIIDIKALGQRIDLGSVLKSPAVLGRLSFEGWAKGPVNRLLGRLALPPDTQLELLGQVWRVRGFEVVVDPKELVLRSTDITRDRGGRIQLEGRLGLNAPQQMQWTVRIVDFPLNDIPGVAPDSLPPLQGTLNATLVVTGNPAAPQLAGEVSLKGVAVGDIILGDGQLTLQGLPPAGTRLRGTLFDRFAINADVSLPKAGPTIAAEVGWQNLDLAALAPAIMERVGFTGRTSGKVKVAIVPNKPLTAELRIDDLDLASRPRNDLLGGGPPLVVKNQGPIVARVQGDLVTLENSRFDTTGGLIEVGGTLQGDQIKGALVRGQLDLALLAPALAPYVQRSEGNITLALRAQGPLSHPRIEGNLTVTRPIEVRFATLDIPVSVPEGRVKISPADLELQNLIVVVGDSRLKLQGRANFDKDYNVTRYGIGIEGSLNAKLLPLLAPGAITEADGTLELRGRIGGTPTKPDFDAKVLVKNVSLRLRDLGRLIRVETGDLTLNPREARIEKLRATIDDQGTITIGAQGQEPGRLVFEQLLPTIKIKYAHLPVRGERLAYRSPGVFALDDIGFALELEGDLQKQLSLSGDVRIVSGRFTQPVAIKDLAISSRLLGESYGRGTPNPLIDDMRLDLRVRTVGDTFLVQNNLAPEMYALVDLHVGGTAGNPQLDGSILPTDGRFQIPGTGSRGYFDLVPGTNSIVFVGTKILGQTTPELNLEAESLVTDVDGLEHNVRMRIRGPVSQAEISFSTTDTGLNQNETLLLLLSGRSSTSSVRFGTSSANLGRNLDTGFQVAGNVTRDLVDNLLQPYISDTLGLLTGDKLQLRPTLGPDGVEVRLFGRAGRYLRLQLNYLQGFQGMRQARNEVRLWLADFFSFRTFAEYLVLPQQGIVETSTSLNLELFAEWPIRFDLP